MSIILSHAIAVMCGSLFGAMLMALLVAGGKDDD